MAVKVVAATIGVDMSQVPKDLQAILGMVEKFPPQVQQALLRAAKQNDPKKITESFLGMSEAAISQALLDMFDRVAAKAAAGAAKVQAAFRNSIPRPDSLGGVQEGSLPSNWLQGTEALQRQRQVWNNLLQGQSPLGGGGLREGSLPDNWLSGNDYVRGKSMGAGKYLKRQQRNQSIFGDGFASDDGLKRLEKESQEVERSVSQILNRDRQMSNRVQLHWDQEASKAKITAQRQREASGERAKTFISGAMLGTALFAGGEGGKLIDTLGLGRTPIGSGYAGGLAGMGAGMSMGMMGGPGGVIAGGAIGAAVGGTVGTIMGVIKMGMDALHFGVSKAMEVIHFGASKILHLGMEYERTLTKFEILTGSRAAGNKLYGGIERMATQTPYTAGQISGNVELMLGYGVSSDNSLAAAKKLGDIAGGDATRYNRLALAFGQVASQGRLMGQELRQFSEAGVGAADFAQTYGKSVLELKADMEAGIVPASIMYKTIEKLTDAGGRFAGMNERVSKTVEGRWNALVGTAEMAGRRIGKSLFERLGIAGRLDSGVNMVQGFMSGGGLDRVVDWLEMAANKAIGFGKSLAEHVYPALVLIKDVGITIAKDLFDGLFDKGGDSWKRFENILVSGVKLVTKAVITLAQTAQAVFPTLVDIGIGVASILHPARLKAMVTGGLTGAAGGGLLGLMGGPGGAMGGAKIGGLLGAGLGYAASEGHPDILAMQNMGKDLKSAVAGIPLGDLARDVGGVLNNGPGGVGIDPVKAAERAWDAAIDVERNARNKMLEVWDHGTYKGQKLSPETRKKLEEEWHKIQGETEDARIAFENAKKRQRNGDGKDHMDDLMDAQRAQRNKEDFGDSRFNVKLEVDQQVQNIFTEMTKALREGISPFEKFTKAIENITKGTSKAGVPFNESFLGIGGGLGAAGLFGPDMQSQILTKGMSDRAKYEAFMKLRGNVDNTIHLPSAAGMDTQEAIKIINEQLKTGSGLLTEEEINETLKQSKLIQDNMDKNIKIVADVLKGKAIVLKEAVP